MSQPVDSRSLFNMPKGTYLLSHSAGCLPYAAEAALRTHFLDPWKELGGDAWGAWLEAAGHFRERLARVLGGHASEYCPQPNVTAGLVKYLSCLDPQPGRNVVLMHRNAFPSLGFAIAALEKAGWALRFVEPAPGETNAEAWARTFSGDVAAALITHVQSNTGLLAPVDGLVALCREYGAASIVDVAQSAGVIPIDVGTWDADLVIGSCLKWLCGGPGAGFMRVPRRALPELEPRDAGWFSHEAPFEFDITNFRYAPDALRFWGATPSVAPMAAAAGALETMLTIGMPAITAHNRRLRDAFLDEAGRNDLGHLLDSRGGTLCIAFGDQATAEAADRALRAEQCSIDRRGCVLRLSFHIYNSIDEAGHTGRLLNGMEFGL